MDNQNTPSPVINPQDTDNYYGFTPINGIGQPGSTVSLDVNGTNTVSTTVAADGTWKTFTGLYSGTNNITANDTNAAGLEGTSDTVGVYGDFPYPSKYTGPLLDFDPSAKMQNSTTANMSGVVYDPDGVSAVYIYSDGKFVGTASVDPGTSTWSYSFDKGAGDFTDITATAYDTYGNASSSTNPFEMITGITGEPYKSEQITDSPDGSIQNAAFFGGNGSLLYSSTSTIDAKGLADAIITGAGNKLTYGINTSDPADEIVNFNAKGNNHDTLDIAGSHLHNMSQLMSHSSFAGGDLTIHLTGHSEITLDGVSKADLKAHPSDIKFA